MKFSADWRKRCGERLHFEGTFRGRLIENVPEMAEDNPAEVCVLSKVFLLLWAGMGWRWPLLGSCHSLQDAAELLAGL